MWPKSRRTGKILYESLPTNIIRIIIAFGVQSLCFVYLSQYLMVALERRKALIGAKLHYGVALFGQPRVDFDFQAFFALLQNEIYIDQALEGSRLWLEIGVSVE